MSAMLTCLSAAIVLGWTGFALSGLVIQPPAALLLGALVAVAAFVARDTVAIRGFVAIMGPIGIVLPVLALRHAAAGAGLAVTPFGTVELLVFLLGYIAFLACAMGYLPADLYRLGYAPLPVGAMVLAICAYGALSGHFTLPLIAVLGQALWVAGWGSSNWFDHVTHALLVPVVATVLVLRLF